MPILVRLLGRPVVQHEGAWLEPPAGLPSALLYYLAYKNAWVGREQLAFLFWPDIPEANARRNLRNLVPRAKDLPFANTLKVERNRIRWQVKTDVVDFRQAISERQFGKAAELYTGELLEGFRLDSASEFDEWLELERAEIAKNYQNVAFSYLSDLEKQGAYAQAAEVLGTLRKSDPFDETLLRRQLQYRRANRQANQALATFEQFKTLLDKEFGAEPELATLELVEAIRQDGSSVEPVIKTPIPEESVQPKALRNLPTPSTALIGREIELTRVAEQLSDPACRLLTLIAPGGMGKTRLALAVAERQQDQFADGVCFMPFASLQSSEQMIFTLANGLGLSLAVQQDVTAQVMSFLADKQMLLVMDNLEHLLDGVSLVSELLETAPKLKILVTSREQLQLRSEWVVDLRGLAYPSEDAANPETYDALKFFVESAKRVRADFVLNKTTLPLATHICQLVEGMPLAIELAVGWLRVLDLSDIVTEIKQGLDLLESSLHDVPERHQSIRAVFDYSWQLLSSKQKDNLEALSLFQGGFDRDAAQQVTGITTRTLLELSSKALLRKQVTGRFDLHPLLQQYAYEKLRHSPSYEDVLSRYRAHFLSLTAALKDELVKGAPRDILSTLNFNLGNFQAVWSWAIQTKERDESHLVSQVMALYYSLSNKYQEGSAVLQKIRASINAQDPDKQMALARVLSSQAWLEARLGNHQKAERLAQEALGYARSHAHLEDAPIPLIVLGATGLHKCHYSEARAYFEEAYDLSEKYKELLYQPICKEYQATLELQEGNLDKAEDLAREALSLNRKAESSAFIISCLHLLGDLLRLKGHLEESKLILLEGLELSRTLNMKMTLAYLLNSLGELSSAAHDLQAAKSYFKETLSLSKEGKDKNLELVCLKNLAELASLKNDEVKTIACYQQALNLAWQNESIFDALLNLLEIIKSIAHHWVEQERVSEALCLLSLYANHEAMPATEQAKLEASIDVYKEKVSEEVFQAALAQAERLNLEEATTYLASNETFTLPVEGLGKRGSNVAPSP